MDSALTPREIQSRIRAGESLDDVARAAGVPVDSIEGYATPVLAERTHMADMAHSAQARRTNGPVASVTLAEVIAARLTTLGVDPDSVVWDAWREEDRADRHWTVRASYQSGSTGHEALFDFDPRGRYTIPSNDDARWIMDDEPQPAAQPVRPNRPKDPDAEPTIDLNDELALVRAIQDDEDEPPVIGSGQTLDELYKAAGSHDEQQPRDPYLEEVDGVYDIVPNPTSDMDVLYDMLAGFDEDSVHVYSGLNRPIAFTDDNQFQDHRPTDEHDAPVADESEPDQPHDAQPDGTHDGAGLFAGDSSQYDVDHDVDTAPKSDGATSARDDTANEPQADAPAELPVDEDNQHATSTGRTGTPAHKPAKKTSTRRTSRSSSKSSSKNQQNASAPKPDAETTDHETTDQSEIHEPEQEPLVQAPDEAGQPKPKPKTSPKASSKSARTSGSKTGNKSRRRTSHRASVPSWDEIMFGEPHPHTKDK